MSDGKAIRTAIGATLRARRSEAGLSLAALSQKAELSPAHISDVERGMKDLSTDRLAMTCAALDVRPADFFVAVGRALGASGDDTETDRPGTRLMQSAERLSPGALRTVAEFTAYLASKETGGRRRRIGFEF